MPQPYAVGERQQTALQKGRDVTEQPKPGISPVLLGSGFAALIVVAAFVFLPAPQIEEDTTSESTPVEEAVTSTIEALTTPEAEPAPEVAEPVVAEEAPELTEPVLAEPEAEPAQEAAEEETASVQEEATPEPAPEVVADAPAAPQPEGPKFDTFRVELDGTMVIAGRAEPGQVVDVVLGGEAIDRVTADSSGAFVALPLASPSEQPRRLILIGDPEGAALESLTSYIVAPIAAPVVVAEAEPEPEAEPAAEPELEVAEVVEEPAIEVDEAPALEETVTAEIAEAP